MIKPNTVKILTYPNAAGQRHRSYYILSGNGGSFLNYKNKNLLPTVSSNLNAYDKINKHMYLITKEAWSRY